MALIEALQANNALLQARIADLEAQVRVIPELTQKLDDAERENAELKRKLIGRTTERSGPKPRKDPARPKNDAGAQRKRSKHRAQRKELPEQLVPHPLPESVKQTCPDCGTATMTELPADESVEYEWESGRLVRRVHARERAMCEQCNGFARAPAPDRVVDGGMYGPGFIARVVVNKVLDCLPLHRQSKMFGREGLHVARSTLGDLYHRAASLIEPLYERMLKLVPGSRVVYADETSLKMQRVKKLGYIWTFATTLYITYVFSPSRSGKTPDRVLGDSEGMLVVDGYTGYNQVTMPGRRTRAGCNAHYPEGRAMRRRIRTTSCVLERSPPQLSEGGRDWRGSTGRKTVGIGERELLGAGSRPQERRYRCRQAYRDTSSEEDDLGQRRRRAVRRPSRCPCPAVPGPAPGRSRPGPGRGAPGSRGPQSDR